MILIFVHLSYLPTSTSVFNGFVESHLRALYINLHQIIFNIFLFKVIPMFYTIVLHVLGKVLVKRRGRFEIFKYNTFCLLTRI